MAKYASKTNFPVITNQIMEIVYDAMGFIESQFCNDAFKRPGANPRQWKLVKVYTHRRAGFTTAALQLLNEYRSSLIVTHNQPAANRLRREAIDNNLVPDWCEQDFYNNIRINDHIMAHEWMDDRWFSQHHSPNERYQLIILDCASMIEASRNNGHRGAIPGMDEFRDRLFNICDLVVELE